MKISSSLKILVAATVLGAASLSMTSCSSYPTPASMSARMANSTGKVFSYNDQNVPAARAMDEVGPLPARAARALTLWLKNSELKTVAYAYPQYFVEVIDNATGRAKVWGLISDGRGNLIGVLIPRSGRPAWELPTTGDYKLYVCQGSQRESLSLAIMNSLSEAGYDEPRLNTRRAHGLTEDRYLVSKPADAAVIAPTVVEAAPAASADAAPAPASTPAAADDDFGSDDFGSDDFGSDDSDSGSDDSDSGSDDDFGGDDFGDDDFGL